MFGSHEQGWACTALDVKLCIVCVAYIASACMQDHADPALATAVFKHGTAERWWHWRAVIGPQASPEQAAKLWQALDSSGAKLQLHVSLEAVCKQAVADEEAERLHV